jgi:ectoine hydroxylase-related dioxygenase (phytanoyl-CoA dioxygenase family)
MNDAQVAMYQQEGFVLLKAVFSTEEINAMDHEVDRLLALDLVDPDNGRTPFRFGAERWPERIDPVVDCSELFARLVADPRLTEPLQCLFNDQVHLFKDKLVLKAPGVDGYELHQDWAWGWQNLCPANLICSVSIQIDGADQDNGGLELFSGSHHKLLTPPGKAMNMGEAGLDLLDPGSAVQVDTQPGDVLIFHALTPHRSGPNRSQRWRRSLYLSVNAAKAGDLRQEYYRDYRMRPDRHGGKFFR